MNDEKPKIENANAFRRRRNAQMKWMMLFGLLVVVAVIYLMYEPKKTRAIVGGKKPEADPNKPKKPVNSGDKMSDNTNDMTTSYFFDYDMFSTTFDNWQDKVGRPQYQAWDYGYTTTPGPSTKQPQGEVKATSQSVVEVEKQIPAPAVVTEPIMISKILPNANNEVAPVVHSDPKIYKVTNPLKVTDFQFFDDYKNPCFASSEKDIRCFPYFFIAGMPRTGTNDLRQRLSQHPRIVGSELKSPDWWTKSDASSKVTLDQYLSHFSQPSKNLKEIAEAESEKGQIIHNSITFDTDPTLFWKGKLDADGTFQTPAHIVKTLPKSKVVLFVRCPTARLYSEYLHFYPKSSPQDFDKFVIREIADFKKCMKTMSEYQCAHKDLEDDTVPHLEIGLYSLFYEEWLKTMSPSQILVVRLEDYREDTSKSIKSITDFLDLTDESAKTTQSLADLKTNTGANPNHPEMLATTSDILNSFYQPYNDRFATLLKNPKLKFT